MPRPKIEGLVTFNLRILQSQLEAIDRIVTTEAETRGDPGITRTAIIREAVAAYVRERERATRAPAK